MLLPISGLVLCNNPTTTYSQLPPSPHQNPPPGNSGSLIIWFWPTLLSYFFPDSLIKLLGSIKTARFCNGKCSLDYVPPFQQWYPSSVCIICTIEPAHIDIYLYPCGFYTHEFNHGQKWKISCMNSICTEFLVYNRSINNICTICTFTTHFKQSRYDVQCTEYREITGKYTHCFIYGI